MQSLYLTSRFSLYKLYSHDLTLTDKATVRASALQIPMTLMPHTEASFVPHQTTIIYPEACGDFMLTIGLSLNHHKQKAHGKHIILVRDIEASQTPSAVSASESFGLQPPLH